MKRWVIISCMVLMAIVAHVFFAADIGSDTAVTRFNNQVIVENGDRIAGFASLAGGFLLGGRNVTATFDCFFGVLGEVDFNFGTLVLNQDLILRNVTSVALWGNITGANHNLELPAKNSCYPLQSTTDICSLSFQASIARPTQVNSVAWSYDSLYIVSGTNATAGNELFVDRVDNETALTAITSINFSENVLSVDWHPSKDWIAVGRASGAGDELYTYTFNRVAGTLTLISSVDFGAGGNNACNSVRWHPDGDHLAVARNSGGAGVKISVYQINTSTGAIVTGGGSPVSDSFSAEGLAVDWNVDGTFLAAGTGNAGGFNEFRVYSFVKSPLTLTLNASADTGQTNTVAFNTGTGNTNILAIGLSSGSDRLRVYSHNSGAGTLTQLAGTVGTEVFSVDWSVAGNCLAVGLARNSESTGGELLVYGFEDNAIDLQDSREVNDDVRSVRYAPNGRLFATGDNGAGSGTADVSLYQLDSAFIGTTGSVIFSNIFLNFNANATFNEPSIRFSGNSVITGRGNVMSLAPTFSIIVQPSSSLLIQNITLQGLSDGQLVVDGSSTVSFQDVHIVLDGDYTFSSGRMEILKDLRVSGPGHSFIYSSTQASIIRSRDPQTASESAGVAVCSPGFRGALIMDPCTIFRYNSTNATNLIQLEGDLARFILNSASLIITTTPLQLTKGKLIIDGRSDLQGSPGLYIGDGASSANNLSLEIRPAANLEVSGKLIYRNI